jgi:hypothetical protein
MLSKSSERRVICTESKWHCNANKINVTGNLSVIILYPKRAVN